MTNQTSIYLVRTVPTQGIGICIGMRDPPNTEIEGLVRPGAA